MEDPQKKGGDAQDKKGTTGTGEEKGLSGQGGQTGTTGSGDAPQMTQDPKGKK